MRVATRALDGDADPGRVLLRLAERARHSGAPGPAALIGDWFGGGAVLAPSLRTRAVAPESAFAPRVTALDAAPGAVGGGWFGYLGYPDGYRDGTGPGLPRAAGGWADHVLRRDRAGRWWFEALADDQGCDGRAAELAPLVAGESPAAGRGWRSGGLATPGGDGYRDAVRRTQAHIAAGEVYQANICTEFRAGFCGDPLEPFVAGVDRFAPARASFLAGDWGAVASLSPELFLARRGDMVTTSPIKGTLPRRGPGDAGNAARLRRSVKDVAENVMIVDMARNDLGRVCAAGSVQVPELLQVAPHPGVWHLVSTVRGQLLPGVDDACLLAAAFPPASVTGTPKARARELIAALEPVPRGVYCGAIGLASPAAGTELAVAIRTLEFAGGAVRFGVGGGITADSDPDAEWDECATKAAPLLDLLAGDLA